MHFTAQLLAIRREQGRLDELVPAIERFASDEPTAAAWRSLLPLAHLDAGDRSLAEEVYERAIEGGGPETMPRTMLWLTAAAALGEAAAELGDVARSARLHAALEPYADHLIQWSFTGNAGSCTACWAGRRPSRGGTTAPRTTSRPPSSGTRRSGPKRCWPARAATTESSYSTARPPTARAAGTSCTRQAVPPAVWACAASPRGRTTLLT